MEVSPSCPVSQPHFFVWRVLQRELDPLWCFASALLIFGGTPKLGGGWLLSVP